MDNSAPWIHNQEFRSNFVETCEKQIIKFSGSNSGYKNEVIKALNMFLEQFTSQNQSFRYDSLSITLQNELLVSLDTIANNQSMLDNLDKFTTFDEKKDEDKQV